MFKHIFFSSILVNNRVILIENTQKIFRLQLQLSTFENFQLLLQLQQNHVNNSNFVIYYYNFSKPTLDYDLCLSLSQNLYLLIFSV